MVCTWRQTCELMNKNRTKTDEQKSVTMLSLDEWWSASADILVFYTVEVEAKEFFQFCGCTTCFFGLSSGCCGHQYHKEAGA